MEDKNRNNKGQFKKGNMMRLGDLNSNPNRSHLALRKNMYSFMETITKENIAEYFAAVPDHQKFTVYATMLDMQNKWGNNDLKIDLEILKTELNNNTTENDVVIDVKFIDTAEDNEDI